MVWEDEDTRFVVEVAVAASEVVLGGVEDGGIPGSAARERSKGIGEWIGEE